MGYETQCGCTDGSANHRTNWKCFSGNVHRSTPLGMLLPPFLFPEMLTFHHFAEQQVFQLHIDVLVYVDLIEDIVGKVLRNPLGVRFPSSQQALIALISIHYCLSFLSPSSPFTPFSPSAASSLLYASSFPPVSPVFQSEMHALTNTHSSVDVMDFWLHKSSQKASRGGQPIS